MKYYLMPEDLRKGLMEYLRSQPLGNVIDGYRALENLREAESQAKPAPLKEVKDK